MVITRSTGPCEDITLHFWRCLIFAAPIAFAAMNVFVTGGAGYIGSVCVEELLNAGHAVTVFDNLTEGHRQAVDERAKFIQGQLGEESAIRKALQEAKPEAIIHFAANALVGESMTCLL